MLASMGTLEIATSEERESTGAMDLLEAWGGVGGGDFRSWVTDIA